jgi:hypothetical protein
METTTIGKLGYRPNQAARVLSGTDSPDVAPNKNTLHCDPAP